MDIHFEPEMVGKVLAEVSKNFSAHLECIPVILEISQEMAFRAYEELRNIVVTDSGTLLCNIEVTDINWFTSYVLSYGSHIRVLEPLEIKEEIIQVLDQ